MAPAKSWSEDDEFWEAMEPLLCASGRLALAEGDVAAIVSGLDLPPGYAVLDLGCGPGAHAIAFAARGCEVTGVDRSRRLLDRAWAAAGARGVHVEWVEADMRAFRRPAAYDLVCSLYTSFGYFSDEEDRVVLAHVHAGLRPGGAFVLDVTGRDAAVRGHLEPRAVKAGGVSYTEQRHLEENARVLVSTWTVVRGRRTQEFQARVRLYSAPELRDLLQSAGFAEVALFGSLTLDAAGAYDGTSTRLVARARAERERTR